MWIWLTLANAATLYVPSEYGSLQDAVDVATPGDIIEIDAGYSRRGDVVEIAQSVTLRGVGGRPVLEALSVVLADVVIENARLRGRNTQGSPPVADDKAVYAEGGSLTLTDCKLVPSPGGSGVVAIESDVTLIRTDAEGFFSVMPVVQVTQAHLEVQDGTFSLNSGVLSVFEGTANITGSVFDRNYADAGADLAVTNIVPATISIVNATFGGGGAVKGGSVFVSGANLELRDSTWTQGSATDLGGAVSVVGTSAVPAGLFVDNCTFTNLQASAGGAIAVNEVAGAVIQNSTFTRNTSLGGGALVVAGGQLLVQQSNFSENQTLLGSGGAVLVTSEALQGPSNTNLDFWGNTITGALGQVDALEGGGIAVFGNATVDIDDSVFTQLQSNFEGGALYVLGEVVVNNSQFLNNQAPWGGAITTYSDMVVKGSLFQDNTAGVIGGAISGSQLKLDVIGSQFVRNHANFYGGAIELGSGHGANLLRNLFCQNTGGGRGVVSLGSKKGDEWFVHNNVFLENVSDSGASLYYSEDGNQSPLVEIRNNNFIRDGGEAAFRLGFGVVDVRNNIVLGNGRGIEAEFPVWTTLSGGYNLWFENGEYGFETLPVSTSLVDVDPMFIQDTPGDCGSVFWVHPDSPVIDAGDPSIFDADGSISDIGVFGGPGALNLDEDGDGVPLPADCNDEDPSIYPGAPDIPYDGIDQNCDGEDLCDVDKDGFLAPECGGDDCRDGNAKVNPRARDVFDDGIDQNCDGIEARSFMVGGGGCSHAGSSSWLWLMALPLLVRRRS